MCCALTLVGCAAEPHNQGNYVDVSLIQGKEGKWTRKEVEQAIGSPSFTDPKNPLAVYYVGAQGKRYPFTSSSIHKTLTLKVEYDHQGRLKHFVEIN